VLSAGEADKGQARIFRTTDGGRRWQLVYTTDLKGVFLDALAFWDSQHGIALSDPVDGRFFVLTTDDGGRSWSRVPPDVVPPSLPGEAAFAASGSCLTIEGKANVWFGTGGGATARVFRSTNRGRSWTVVNTPIQAGSASTGIFSIAFRDTRHGVVAGGDYQQPKGALPNVALSGDGGRSWREPKGPLAAGYFSAVAYLAQNGPLVAVGLAGTATSSDGGESWTVVDTVPYNSVRFAPDKGGWAVGPRGRIGVWRAARPR
jgi:photosystem II stability/assembly factor-like uncharacterized protein